MADPAGQRATGPVDFFTTGFFEPGGFVQGGSEELLEFLPSFSSRPLIRFCVRSTKAANSACNLTQLSHSNLPIHKGYHYSP